MGCRYNDSIVDHEFPFESRRNTELPEGEEPPARFPGRQVAAVVALIVLHALIVLWIIAVSPEVSPFEWGGLRKGRTALEPWRLFTSLLLHADLRHVVANGLSMLVFGVPLLEWVGRRRTGWVYLAAGLGGGIAAVTFASYGTTIIGSSGAVSGLFGAWVVLSLHRARAEDLPGRARIRTAGIALLVLPSLINPSTPGGQPISVSSHLAGAAVGMIVGAYLSRGWLRHADPFDPERRIEA